MNETNETNPKQIKVPRWDHGILKNRQGLIYHLE